MPQDKEARRFLTQQEVADVLRRSVAAVARLRRKGELAWLPGSPILIPAEELDAYLDRKMVARREKAEERARPAPRRTPEEAARRMVEKMRAKGELGNLQQLLRDTKRHRDKM